MTEEFLITSSTTEDLSAEARAAILRIVVEALQTENAKNLFNYVRSGGWHFLAYRAEELVSHAMVTTRWLQPQGQPILKTAYVDAVATLPAFQGRGYGSALMRDLASATDAEFVIACLETERPTFYERLGWQIWRGPLAGRSEQGLIPTPEQRGIMVLRLSRTPTLDLDSGLSIETQTGRIW